jgi:hypothetical protein
MKSQIATLVTCLLLACSLAVASGPAALADAPPDGAAGAVYSMELPSLVSGSRAGASLEIDATGRRHAAFWTYLSGEVIYATCATNCTQAANWTSAQVGDNGQLGARPVLRLTASGQPRLMYDRLRSGGGLVNEMIYNACDNACTNPANWTELAIASYRTVGYAPDTRYFDLDPQGRPRALASADNEQMTYFECNASCTASSSNWTVTGLGRTGLQPSIALDASGTAHVVFRANDPAINADNNVLFYAVCSQTCSDAGQWGLLPIVLTGRDTRGRFAVAADSSGRPRLAFFSGDLAGTAADAANRLFYYWCDSDCVAPGSAWQGYDLGLAPKDGASPDLVLDANNRPHISYLNDDSQYQVGYIVCTAACESGSPTWQGGHLESPLDYPPPPNRPGCFSPFWYVVSTTALTLDANGNPHIVFDVRNTQNCGGSIQEVLRVVRYFDGSQLNNPPATATPGPSPTPTRTPVPAPTFPPGQTQRVYVPAVIR